MKDETSRIDIPISGCRPSLEEKRSAGPSKTPTPIKPPTRPSQRIGIGLGAIQDAHPSTTMKMETMATISAVNPESIYFLDMVPPPWPRRTKQTPIFKDVRKSRHVV